MLEQEKVKAYLIDELETLRKRIAELERSTGRQRAERSLQRTLSLLRATLESTADGILVVDTEGKIVSFNEKFIEMWQIPESVLASRDDNKALGFVLSQLKDPEGFLTKVKQLYGQADTEGFDVLEFKDGRIFERYSQPQRIEGKCVGRVWSFRNITDRKRMEEALLESEKKFRSFVETTNEWIWSMDLEGRFTYSNPTVRAILGYSPEELQGIKCLDLIHEDDRFKVMEMLPQRIAEKSGWTGFVVRWRHKDGIYRYLECNSVPIISRDGELIGYRGADRDVTERMLAEQVLRQTHDELERAVEERTAELSMANLAMRDEIAERKRVEEARDYQARLLDQVSDAVIATDLEGKVVSWNSGAESLYGWSGKEVLGQPIAILEDTGTMPRGKVVISVALSEGIWRGEKQNVRKDGRRIIVRLTVTPVRDSLDRVIGMVGISHDITERKQAQEELMETNERLGHAMEKLQQLSRHVLEMQENEYKSISRELHDNIAQSVNAVKMRLERLDRENGRGLIEYRREIQLAVSQLRKISQEVRRLSKHMRPEILDELGLIATLETFIKDFQRNTGIQTEFIYKLTAALLPPNLETHLYRIVQEALNNVIKHACASYVVIRLEEIEKNLHLSIMDNGLGFCWDQLVKEKKAIEGIGLISIQERANLFKGTTEILSSPENGTRIAVTIPLEQ